MRHLLLLAIALFGSAVPASARDEVPAYPLTCVYAPAGGEVDQFRHCARREADGVLRLSPRHARKLTFDDNGLAAINIEDSWYYFRHDGVSAPVETFDNWAAEFTDGLAVSPSGGKVGFIDSTLTLVIPRRYDVAMPFSDGIAAVCFGCVVIRDYDHAPVFGGVWTCIDRDGKELMAPRPLAPPDEGFVELCAPWRRATAPADSSRTPPASRRETSSAR